MTTLPSERRTAMSSSTSLAWKGRPTCTSPLPSGPNVGSAEPSARARAAGRRLGGVLAQAGLLGTGVAVVRAGVGGLGPDRAAVAEGAVGRAVGVVAEDVRAAVVAVGPAVSGGVGVGARGRDDDLAVRLDRDRRALSGDRAVVE